MAQPIFVEPTWGRSLSEGLNSGFDQILNALTQRRLQEKEVARYNAGQQRLDFASIAEYGTTPSRYAQGQELAAQGEPTYTDPQALQERSVLLDEYNNFNTMLKDSGKAKLDKAKADARLTNAKAFWEEQGPTEPQVTEIQGMPFVRSVNRGRVQLTAVPKPERGTAEAVESVASSLGAAANIDDYFNAVNRAGPEFAKKMAMSNMPGRDFMFPEVAQKETAMLTAFQFMMGGKAFTESEKAMIQGFARNAAFGPEQRAAARLEMGRFLTRRMKGYANSNLLGADKQRILGKVKELEAQFGVDPSKRAKFEDRAKQLEAMGLSDEQAFELMNEEGYQ